MINLWEEIFAIKCKQKNGELKLKFLELDNDLRLNISTRNG